MSIIIKNLYDFAENAKSMDFGTLTQIALDHNIAIRSEEIVEPVVATVSDVQQHSAQSIVPASVQPENDTAATGKPSQHKFTFTKSFEPSVRKTLRVILSMNKNNRNTSNVPFYYECNGLVLDSRTWKILAVPPCGFNARPKRDIINRNLSKNMYDIININDGTVLTLYHWTHPTDGNIWSLASSNGYDVTPLLWMGSMTYAEIVYDLASRLYPDFCKKTGLTLNEVNGVKRLCFTNLDTTKCYTIGVRHHNFHPMHSDSEKIWQIQYADLTGTVPKIIYGSGLPVIPEQSYYTQRCTNIEELYELCNASLDNFLKTMENPNYGFILRSRKPNETTIHSDIIVESKLLVEIRNIMYRRAPAELHKRLTPTNRLQFNIMRAVLTTNKCEILLKLFPNFKSTIIKYKDFTSTLITNIVNTIRQREMGISNEKRNTKMKNLVYELILHISKYEKNINAFHTDAESILTDYFIRPEYAFLYLSVIEE